MKRILSLLFSVVMLLSIFTLTACTTEKAKVSSVLSIDADFVGHRTITVKYPLSVHIDELKKQLIKADPFKNSENSKFEYLGVEQDGYAFEMDIVFTSHDDYISQVSKLIGRKVHSSMSQPQTVLCEGTRIVEDFDTAELVAFMQDISKANKDTAAVEFEYSANSVSVENNVYNTGSTVDVSDRDGKAINSITIETTNLKDGNYDRTVTFSIPNKTYDDLSGSIKEYFLTNTSPAAQYCDWTSLGSSWEYKVIFKSLSLDELKSYTAMLLDTDNADAFYGDKNNSSTPLSEELVFEEEFDTFSFIGHNGKGVEINYKYALPTKTTHGDGKAHFDGKWNTVGSWLDGVYSVSTNTDVVDIRIPDGIQYAINGIDMTLEVVGEDSFVRTTSFLYSKTQGMDGMLYLKDFFENLGAKVITDEDDDNLICSVVMKGSSAKLNDMLAEYFGSNNTIEYTINDNRLKLNKKTNYSEQVDLSYMLNSTNANRPITYTVTSSNNEDIISLSCGDMVAKNSKRTSTLPMVYVEKGQGVVMYNGKIPDVSNIIIYSSFAMLLLCALVAIFVYMVIKRRTVTCSDEQLSLMETQTDVNATADDVDEEHDKLLKEIDDDINEKIKADMIENKSKQLKAQEIEILCKMVNGDIDTDIDKVIENKDLDNNV